MVNVEYCNNCGLLSTDTLPTSSSWCIPVLSVLLLHLRKGSRIVTSLYQYVRLLHFQDGKRLSEKTGEIATTAKTRPTQRIEGRGRGKGSERGRETRVNATTPTTRTKRSTGIAEATRRNQRLLMTATLSRRSKASAGSFLLSKAPARPLFAPFDPSVRGCCCYLCDLNILSVHKRDGTRSASRL